MWAKEALFRRYARMVNGLVYRLIGRDSEVEDLAQESFLAVFGGLSRLKEPQAFASFLASTTVRTVHRMLKRRRLLARLRLRSPELLDPERLLAPTASPEDAAELRAILGIVRDLPVPERLVLMLHRVEGHKIEEIVELTGSSKATVKRRLARAEARLVERLGE